MKKRQVAICIIAAAVAAYSFGATSANGARIDPATLRQEAVDRLPADDVPMPAHLRFPYISSYYVKPEVREGERARIGFFATDYDSSKVRYLDDSKRFDVKLELHSASGCRDFVRRNIPSGDGEFDLGVLPAGEYTVRMWSVDRENGLESHRVLQDFRVVAKVRDDARAVYRMTAADLAKYGIRNDGATEKPVPVTDPEWPLLETNAVATLAGLQRFIDDKASNGVRRVVLLPGTYRISHTGCIRMPDDFTLDLGGATIKENGFTGHHALMVGFRSARDSRLVNGTLEGDYHEHDYANSKHNSEWPMGFSFGGGCSRCVVSNVVVKDITGYGGGNNIGKDERGALWTFLAEVKGRWTSGGLDPSSGEVAADERRFTSDFQDFRRRSGDLKRLQISKLLGYQGCAGRNWFLTVCWYDADRKFIAAETGFQYRPMLIPANARYLRFSVDTPDEASAKKCGFHLVEMRIPVNCSVVDCRFDNCRCVGYAAGAMKNMLFKGNEFTRCGQKAAKCAFDAEDGWDQMQDVFFTGNRFHGNPVNNGILACAGHNFVIEDTDGDVYLWERTYSACVRGNRFGKAVFRGGGRLRAGFARIVGNTYARSLTLGLRDTTRWTSVISGETLGNDKGDFCFNIGKSGLLVDCTVKGGKNARLANLDWCHIENTEIGASPAWNWRGVSVKDSRFNAAVDTNKLVDCSFDNVKFKAAPRQK